MAYVEKTPEPEEDAPELTPVVLKLDSDVHEIMVELMQRTGFDASELVGWALGAYWREIEGIVLPPPTSADIECVLARSEEDLRAGRTYAHKEVMAEARKIVGG